MINFKNLPIEEEKETKMKAIPLSLILGLLFGFSIMFLFLKQEKRIYNRPGALSVREFWNVLTFELFAIGTGFFFILLMLIGVYAVYSNEVTLLKSEQLVSFTVDSQEKYVHEEKTSESDEVTFYIHSEMEWQKLSRQHFVLGDPNFKLFYNDGISPVLDTYVKRQVNDSGKTWLEWVFPYFPKSPLSMSYILRVPREAISVTTH